jgi:hypothetical protein
VCVCVCVCVCVLLLILLFLGEAWHPDCVCLHQKASSADRSLVLLVASVSGAPGRPLELGRRGDVHWSWGVRSDTEQHLEDQGSGEGAEETKFDSGG